MSRLFNRTVRVEIEADGSLFEVADVRCQFQCRKTRSDSPNELTVRLFNLNEQTRRNAVKVGATVRLYAGYGEESVLLAQSQVTRSMIERTPPDIVIVLECLDGIDELRKTRVSVSFDRNATVRQAVDAVAARLGRPVRPIDVNLSVPLRGGYTHVGGIARALDDLTARVGATWSIQNGDLLILGPNGRVPGEVTLLTPDTGLLYSPEPVEDDTSTERQGGETRHGWRLTALLQPQIQPGDQVRVESADVNGVFVVDEIDHNGDTRGLNYTSTMVVFE